MDFLVELVLEILVDGALAGTVSRKVPLPLRILLGAVLLLFFGGIIGLVLWTGASSGSGVLVLLGFFLLGCCCFWVKSVWKNRRK